MREQLEAERHQLLHSYTGDAAHDGKVRDRIVEIDHLLTGIDAERLRGYHALEDMRPENGGE